MEWSPQQEMALKAVKKWLKDKTSQVFYLAGYAGTGKSTLAFELASGVKKKVFYGAFTGKAAEVMQRKGCTGATTIHSMIYSIDQEAKGWEPKFRLNHAAPCKDAGLIVIDEVSMVDEALALDLLSFGVKVLVLGDPAQLPPVKGAGYFTSGTPDFMLTEVHRQAAENPIIRLSMDVRQKKRLTLGWHGGTRVIRKKDIDDADLIACDQVIVGRNKTRVGYNNIIRRVMGMQPEVPEFGDKLICLRNNREKKLMNGGMWRVVEEPKYNMGCFNLYIHSENAVDAKPTEVNVLKEFFTGNEDKISYEERQSYDDFTFGYAITCHKSQGSQWDNIFINDEKAFMREDAHRWLYTALTRAAEIATIAIDAD